MSHVAFMSIARIAGLIAALALLVVTTGDIARAQAPPAEPHDPQALLPREHHPWGHFHVGSWKRVRVYSETLDDSGRVVSTSTTETTTTLISADELAYALQVDVVVEVAGKRFQAQPQVIRQGYVGQKGEESVVARRLRAANVTVDGREIACDVRQFVVEHDGRRRTTVMHYSPLAPPHVLRSETTSTDLEGKTTHYQTRVEIVAVGMPHQVLTEIKPTTHVKTVHTTAKSTTITVEAVADDVPGGVVAHWSKEVDSTGRVLARSTLTLIDYGVAEEVGERTGGILIRRRLQRQRLR